MDLFIQRYGRDNYLTFMEPILWRVWRNKRKRCIGVHRFRNNYPWFGGKTRCAHIVWARFGTVINYIEPFAGSLGCLFKRPKESFHPTRQNIETVNDLDCFIANFWRAVRYDPDSVSNYCDWIVNEAELHARHDWLMFSEHALEFRHRMHHNPEYYDCKIAGAWVYGCALWIGSGWCTDQGKGRMNGKVQTPRGIPSLGNAGRGVCRPVQTSQKIPNVGSAGMGIHRQSILATDPKEEVLIKLLERIKQGVTTEHREKILAKLSKNCSPVAQEIRNTLWGNLSPQIPQLASAGCGIHRPSQNVEDGAELNIMDRPGTRPDLYLYMRSICDRLRSVRIVCGDWSRVCKPSVTTFHGITAILLDPPYSSERAAGKNRQIFAQDDVNVAHKVRTWSIENGSNPNLRIALCGHGHEHTILEDLGWVPVKLKGTSGYSHGFTSEAGKLAKSETIWFSPNCVKMPEDLEWLDNHKRETLWNYYLGG